MAPRLSLLRCPCWPTQLQLLETRRPQLLSQQLLLDVMSCSLLSGWPSVRLVGVQEDMLSGSATAQMENKRRNLTGSPRTRGRRPVRPPGRPSFQIPLGGRAAGPERQLPCTRLPCDDISPSASQPRELHLEASDF